MLLLWLYLLQWLSNPGSAAVSANAAYFCCKRSHPGRCAARMIVAGPFKARTPDRRPKRISSRQRRIACLPRLPALKGRPKLIWPLRGQNDLKKYAALAVWAARSPNGHIGSMIHAGGSPALPGRGQVSRFHPSPPEAGGFLPGGS